MLRERIDQLEAEKRQSAQENALQNERIAELEAEKRQSAQENAQQNKHIAELQTKLAKQQTMFEQVMNRLKTLMPGDSKP